MNQAIALPASQMRLRAFEDLTALRARYRCTEIVANKSEHTAQADLLCGFRDGCRVALGTCSGVDDRGEPAAQCLERSQLGRQSNEIVVKAAFKRHPDPPVDLGGLAKRQRFAERLCEVMVGIDKPRHHELAFQADSLQPGIALHYMGRGSQIAKLAVRNQESMVADRSIPQHDVIGDE